MYAAGLGPDGPAMCLPLHRRVHGVAPETAPAMCARAPRGRPGLLHVYTGGDQALAAHGSSRMQQQAAAHIGQSAATALVYRRQLVPFLLAGMPDSPPQYPNKCVIPH